MPRRRNPLAAAAQAALLAALAAGGPPPVASAQEPPPAGESAPPPPATPAEAYEARRKENFAKIAAAFEYPAVFATQNRLKRTALGVWRTLLEYDPDHRKARDALGYDRKGGEWVLNDAKQRKVAALEDEGEEKRGEFEKRMKAARTGAARLQSELGALAEAAGDVEKARAHWKTALSWDDQEPVANERMGNSLVDGRWRTRRKLAHQEFEKSYGKILARAQALAVQVTPAEETSEIPEKAGLKFKRYRTTHFRFESDLPDPDIRETLVWLERSRTFFLELFHLPERTLDFSAYPYVLVSAKKKEDYDRLVDACPEIPAARKSWAKKFSANMLASGALCTWEDGESAQRNGIHNAAHHFVGRAWGRPGPWLLEALANAVAAAVKSSDLRVCFSGDGSTGGIRLENMRLELAPGVLRELVLAGRDTPMEEFVTLPADGMTPQQIAKAWSVVMFLLEKDGRLAVDYFESASHPASNGARSRDAQYLGAYFPDLLAWKDLDAQWREWAVDVYAK